MESKRKLEKVMLSNKASAEERKVEAVQWTDVHVKEGEGLRNWVRFERRKEVLG